MTIAGADSATEASGGTTTVVSNTEARFKAENNTFRGNVVRWIDIAPGADGTFTIVTNSYEPTPSNWTYAPSVAMIREYDAPPVIPTGLTATAVSGTEIDVTWDDTPNENGYDLEVSVDGGSFAAVGGSPFAADTTAFDATGLTTGSEYCYRIQTFNGAGTSGFSAPVCAVAPFAPATPLNLDATATGKTTIDVSWDDVADETSYELEMAIGGGGFNPVSGSPFAQDTTTFNLTGATHNIEYCFQLTAVGVGGSSTPAGPVCATPFNTAPDLTSVVVTPDNPGLTQTVTATPTATDVDGDLITYTYTWLVNDLVVGGEFNSTLDLTGHVSDGAEVKAQVSAFDGEDYSSLVTSAPVTVDGAAPVITLLGDNPQEVNEGGPYTEAGATALDAVDGDVTAGIVIDATAIDVNVPDDYDVTYTVTDSAGNTAMATRTVTVLDQTAPVITLVGDDPQEIPEGGPYVELGATAFDAVDGDITGDIVIDDSAVDVNTPGDYDVTYNVSDAAGNAATTVTRTVTVTDDTPPVITLVGDDPQNISQGGPYIELGATAFDAVDGDITGDIVIDDSAVDVNTPGVYEVSYDVSDAAGNAATTVLRTVAVIDATAPVIALAPAANGLSVGVSWGDVEDEISYQVETAPDAGGPFTASGGPLAVDTTTATVTTTPGQTICIRIYAERVTGDFDSNIECVTTPSAPDAPTISIDIALTGMAVNIGWTDVATETSYQVQSATTAGGPFTNVGSSLPAGTTSGSVPNLPGHPVCIRVVATNAVGSTSSNIECAPRGDSYGLVDPTTGMWTIYDVEGDMKSFYFGNPGDEPMLGDWNCDGIDTPGLYRQSDGYVYLRNSNTQGNADISYYFGNPGDIPLAGDFNGDGCDTVSLYRPSEARFYVIDKLGSGDQGLGAATNDYLFGDAGDIPFAGDFDGDGVDTFGLYRTSTGSLYYRNTHTQGIADYDFYYGNPGDRFMSGDWIADGVSTPGVFRPSTKTVYLRYHNTQGNANATYPAPVANLLPVAGMVGDLP
jgi:hypothetical protein